MYINIALVLITGQLRPQPKETDGIINYMYMYL